MSWLALFFGAAFLCALIYAIYQKRYVRRTLNNLDSMIIKALDGEFSEDDYDESLKSSIETKFARYLAASSKSFNGVKEEKERIKTLISDISHQTRTPVANIRLYTQLDVYKRQVLQGFVVGFEEEFPLKLYLLYLLFTIVPTIVIYVFQHSLSIIFKNQAVAFFVGIIGEFAGIFSMFLPNVPFLRKSLLWGYYGVLQFVGLFGWTKETRYENAYFDIMPIDWTFFWVLSAAGIIIYFAGKRIFCKGEV